MVVRAIEEIDSHNHEIKVQLTLRQKWNDFRLAFDDNGGKIKYLTHPDPTKVWKPDSFFANSRSEQTYNLMTPNTLVRSFPNGDVFYSTRLTLKLGCPMDLVYFPHDLQSCHIVIASYGQTTDEIVLLLKDQEPVEVSSRMMIKDFSLVSYSSDYATSRSITGTYSAIKAFLVFRRETSRYCRQVFGPSLAFLILSYVSLWLKSPKHRFLLALASVLLVSFFVLDTNHRLPQVAYWRSIDDWTGFVFVMPIINLLIVALTNHLPEQETQTVDEKSVEDGAGEPLVHDKKESKLEVGRKALAKVTKARFELAARLMIPIITILFVMIYFIKNLLREDL